MAFSNGQFRAAFPEFADTVRYPDARILFFGQVATSQGVQAQLGAQADMAAYLYVAHYLAITPSGPGVLGGGPVSSKSVGPTSVSYDTSQGKEEGAGQWNLTPYGKQYWRLVKLYGAGCIQL